MYFFSEVNTLVNEMKEKNRPTWFADEVEKIVDEKSKDLVKRMVDQDQNTRLSSMEVLI